MVETPFNGGANCLADGKEPNDDSQGAQTITNVLNIGTDLMGMSYCGDEDWYRLFVGEEQTLYVDVLSDAQAEGELSVSLLNVEMNAVGVADARPGAHLIELDAPGTYYLQISGDGTPRLYDLLVLRTTSIIEI